MGDTIAISTPRTTARAVSSGKSVSSGTNGVNPACGLSGVLMSALFSVVGAWIAPSSRQGRSDQKLAKPSGFLLPPDV